MSRRQVLQAGAGLASGSLLGESAVTTETPTNVYDALGVKRVINAMGTFTSLGGSVMPPEVVAAWVEASKSFVDLIELQEKASAAYREVARRGGRPHHDRRGWCDLLGHGRGDHARRAQTRLRISPTLPA